MLNSAKQRIFALQSERLMLSAAAALTAKEELPVTMAEVDGKLVNLYNSVRMAIEGGNRQTVNAGEIPVEPFSVKVTANNQPIENLTVSLFDDKNKKIATAFSDYDGIAYFFLDSKAPTARGTHGFTAKIELQGAKNPASVSFSYTVKTKDLAAQISVTVSHDLKSGTAEIQRAATEMLSNHGINNDRCACVKINVEVSDVPGKNVEGLSSTRTVVQSRATAQISVSDAKGKQLFSGSVEQQGTANSRFSAVAAGTKNMKLNAAMLGDIQSAVEAQLAAESQKTAAAQAFESKKIVVFPLTPRGFGGYWYVYSNFEGLTSMLTTALVNTGVLTVLERQQLDAVQSEKNFGNTEELDEAKVIGADWAVVGNLTRISSDLIETDVRIVEIKTSKIVASVSASGRSVNDFRSISQELVRKLNLPTPPESNAKGCCK